MGEGFFLGFEKRAAASPGPEDYLEGWDMNEKVRNSPFSEQAKEIVGRGHIAKKRRAGAHIGALSGALAGAGAGGLKGALVGSVAGTLLGGGAGDVYARATQQAKINEAERLYNKRKVENPFRAHEIPVMKLPLEKRKRLATTLAKIDAKHNDDALRNAHKEIAVHRATR